MSIGPPMVDATDLNDADSSGLVDPIVRRAHKRWKKCRDWEATARNNWLEDRKFANGDSRNNYQWPADIQSTREEKPSLTINEVREKNLLIKNEAKQNKAAAKYRPTGGEATMEAAEVYEGIYRRISNQSNAQAAQGKAIEFQVDAGLGYTVIESDYVDPSPKPGPDAFNQEIYIRLVDDPLCVYLDPDAKEPDGKDARYGFWFGDRPIDEVLEEYPRLKGKLNAANAVDGQDGGWIREDHVRDCLYYEVKEDKDELLGDDEGTTTFASQVPAELVEQWEEEHEARGSQLKRRDVIRKSVVVHKIIGDQLLKTTPLPGKSIPIVPWVGEVTVIEQCLDRKGHTRALISAQQALNYNWSAAVEFGALQSKTPWITPVAAIGDYMTYWQTANTVNHSVLPWVSRDEEGRDIPAPQRATPPQSAPVYMEGVQMARLFMQAASGQYDAMVGAPSNERSGKAINERQRMGDKATYHFIDNQALAIRRQGEIILEWIPTVYDTQRTVQIMAEDNSLSDVQIQPDAPEAHRLAGENEAIKRIFNPRLGSYEVVSDTGPDYATQRQEAFNAVVQILSQAPEFAQKIGDLLFRVADFPLADEMAERLKPGLAPEAQAAITELQKQLAGKNKLLGEAMQSLTEERLKSKAKDTSADVNAFRADTDRSKMLLDAATKIDPAMAMEMIREMANAAVQQALQDNLGPVRGAAAPDLQDDASAQPLPGATGGVSPTDVAPTLAPGMGPVAAGGM